MSTRWVRCSIRIRLWERRGGFVPIDAYTRDGLAVHRQWSDPAYWSVTHVRSGRQIIGGLSYHQTRFLAGKLLRLGRWDRPHWALAKGLRKQAKELLKREGYSGGAA